MNKHDEALVKAISKVSRLLALAEAERAANVIYAMDEVTLAAHNARKTIYDEVHREFQQLRSDITSVLAAAIEKEAEG